MRPPLSTRILRYAAWAATVVATVYPLLFMIFAAFKTPLEFTVNFWLPPRPAGFTLDNLREVWLNYKFYLFFRNSVVVSAAASAGSMVLAVLAGYAFARLRFRGRDRVFSLLLAALVIPAQVAMLPLFLMLKSMGLVNTYLGVIVPGMASIFGIFLVRQFALSIPQELLDAARVDGASEWQIYRSVVLPLLRPILVTLGVFVFMGTWNDFMWPLIVLTDDSMYTLPVALANLMGEHFQDTELMMAGAVLTVLPVVVLFAALQRFYIAGVMSGSLKG